MPPTAQALGFCWEPSLHTLNGFLQSIHHEAVAFPDFRVFDFYLHFFLLVNKREGVLGSDLYK